MSTWDEALNLRANATAALDAAGLDVVVVLDGADAMNNLLSGADVLLIPPPRIERTGTALEVQTWTMFGICHQSDDVTEWWPALDAMTEAIAEPLEIETSEARWWTTIQGNEFPATQYTTTT